MSRARNATFYTPNSVIAGINFNTEPNPNAGILLKSKDDETQKRIFDNYRTWRMDLLKDIPEISTESTEPQGGSGAENPAERPGAPAAAAPNPTVDRPAAATPEQKEEWDKQAVGATVHDVKELEARNGFNKTPDGEISDLNVSDSEYFINWLSQSDVNPASFAGSYQRDLPEDEIETYKDLISYVSSFFLHSYRADSQDNASVFKNIVGSNWGDRFNPIVGAIESALKPDGGGEFYASKHNDRQTLISFVYTIDDGDGSVEYTIPITIVNGIYSGSFKTFVSDQICDYILLTSKGAARQKLSDVAKRKLSVSSSAAVYLGTRNRTASADVDKFTGDNLGKTFNVVTRLDKSVEVPNSQTVKDFLKPTTDSNGDLTYMTQNLDPNNEGHDHDKRIAAAQKLVDFATFRSICKNLRIANWDTDLTNRAKAAKELSDFLGIEYKGRALPLLNNGEANNEPSTFWNPLSGKTRINIIKELNSYYWDKIAVSKDCERMIGFFMSKSIPVLTIHLNDPSGTSYLVDLALKFNSNKRTATCSFYKDGKDGESFSINITLESTWGGIISDIVSKAFESNNPILGPYKSQIESITDIKSALDSGLISLDFRSAKDWTEPVYPINSSRLNEAVPDDNAFETQLANNEHLKWGIYLNISPDLYLNSGINTNDAYWGLIDSEGKDDKFAITTDIYKVIAPIYRIELQTPSGGVKDKFENNVDTTSDVSIQGSNAVYKKDPNKDVYEFEHAEVSMQWLGGVADTEGFTNGGIGTFVLKSVDFENHIIIVAGKADGVFQKLNITDEDTIRKNIKAISEKKSEITIASVNGANLTISGNKLKFGDSDAELLGINNRQAFVRIGDQVQTFAVGSDNLNKLKSTWPEFKQKFALGIYNNEVVYMTSSTNGLRFWINLNGKTKELKYSNGDIKLGKNQIVNKNNPTINDNLSWYFTNSKEYLAALKKTISSKLELLAQTNGIAVNEMLTEIEGFDGISETLSYVNGRLEELKYQFATGRYPKFNIDGSFEEIPDKTIDVYHTLMRSDQDFIKSHGGIASISLEQTKLNTSEIQYYFVSLQDGTDVHGKITFDRGQWSNSFITEAPEDLQTVVDNVLNAIKNWNQDAYEAMKNYFDAYASTNGNITPELNETFDMAYDLLSEELQDQVDELLSKLGELYC